MKPLHRGNAICFSFVLLFLILASGCNTEQKSHTVVNSEGASTEEVTAFIYFVPANVGLIEPELAPDILFGNTSLSLHEVTLVPVTDWESAAAQIANSQAKALIIHHAALDGVNQAELQSFFEDQSLVVAGIGIPGLRLAEFLGHPALFTATWSADEGYTTPYYFYVYSLQLSGSEAEIERLKELGWTPGEQLPANVVASGSVGVTFGSTTDSLLGEEGLTKMLDMILSHVSSSNSYTYAAESAQETDVKIDRNHLPPTVNEETATVEDYLLVPHLIAPEEFYSEQPLDAPVEGVSGFPVAYLAKSQAADVQQVALFVAESGTFADEKMVGFGILSSIRYTFGDGRILYISTTHLSPAALKQTISFSGRSVMLPTQGEAWLDTGVGLPRTPRSLNFVKDDFIITVTGDVIVDDLLAIADQIVFE